MRSIYEINADIVSCYSIDGETGEIIGIDEERLAALEIERSDKLEGVALAVKNLRAENKAMQDEIESFTARKKQNERMIDGYQRYLSHQLEGQKFSTAKVVISFREVPSVSITDETLIPEEYLRTKTEITPDKVAIRAAISAGGTVPGATIERNPSLQIK